MKTKRKRVKKKKRVRTLAVVVVILLLLGILALLNSKGIVKLPTGQQISNFEECAAAGYPVMESYPRQCRTIDGRTFVEELGCTMR